MSNYKEKLEAIPYNSLKAEFIKLGVGPIWKSGVKKVELIYNAVQALERMASEESEDSDVENIIEEIKAEDIEAELVENEKERSEFDKAVSKIVDQKELWTKEAMAKRIKVYANIFDQHRGNPKGDESLFKQETLQAAFDLIF